MLRLKLQINTILLYHSLILNEMLLNFLYIFFVFRKSRKLLFKKKKNEQQQTTEKIHEDDCVVLISPCLSLLITL